MRELAICTEFAMAVALKEMTNSAIASSAIESTTSTEPTASTKPTTVSSA
jgi:hypothetical protein